jgi:ABC-type spermidine/putrescine transport system permease subunit II
MTVLVSPPGESTLPVRMYTLIANTREGDIATLGLIQIFSAIIPTCLFGLLFGMDKKL